MLSACTAFSDHAPVAASKPWTAPPTPADWQSLAVDGVHHAPTSSTVAEVPEVDPQKTYDLPELVNLAQLNNPVTRVAWSQARQAASAIGLSEAAYLPMLSANVIGGKVSTKQRLPEVLGERLRVDSSVKGYAAMLGLEWLLFDFGGRASANEAAHYLSSVANFSFNVVHQQLAFNVTSAYYAYGAAMQREKIADQALTNTQAILRAAQARRKNGLATSVEVAQAQQLVAQMQLQKAMAQGASRNAYQLLVQHVGVPYDTRLTVTDGSTLPLPMANELPKDGSLRRALADRPDILASIASLKAAESAVEVARSSFLPKVYLAGFVLGGNNNLGIGPLSGLSNSGSTHAVVLGMSVPLYDGGIRSAQLFDAQERVSAAQATVEKLRSTALSEMVTASNVLDNALASYHAAQAWVETTAFTYNAALETYKEGLGTVTVATEAATLLLEARGALVDAHAASLTAAAALALALGQLDVNTPDFRKP